MSFKSFLRYLFSITTIMNLSFCGTGFVGMGVAEEDASGNPYSYVIFYGNEDAKVYEVDGESVPGVFNTQI